MNVKSSLRSADRLPLWKKNSTSTYSVPSLSPFCINPLEILKQIKANLFKIHAKKGDENSTSAKFHFSKVNYTFQIMNCEHLWMDKLLWWSFTLWWLLWWSSGVILFGGNSGSEPRVSISRKAWKRHWKGVSLSPFWALSFLGHCFFLFRCCFLVVVVVVIWDLF